MDVSEIIEEKNYYPFGLLQKGYNNVVNGTQNKYKTFQGQELEKELGKNTYAYQWRDYDPALGRFNKIDRFAEKYESYSPYAFTINNPILHIEIKGDSIRTSFRTGFLGIFGKKVSVDYKNGKYYESGTNNVYTGKLRNYQKSLLSDLSALEGDNSISGLVSSLVNSKEVFEFKNERSSEGGGAEFSRNKGKNIIKYSAGSSIKLNGVGQNKSNLWSTSIIALVHEMGHAEDYANNGMANFSNTWYISNIDNKRVSNSEQLAIHRENQYRASKGLPLREWYSAEYIKSPGTANGQFLSSGTRSSATGVTGYYINGGRQANNNYIPYKY